MTAPTGSLVFFANLIRRLPMRMKIGLVTMSAYLGDTTATRGSVLHSSPVPDTPVDFVGFCVEHVFVVECGP